MGLLGLKRDMNEWNWVRILGFLSRSLHGVWLCDGDRLYIEFSSGVFDGLCYGFSEGLSDGLFDGLCDWLSDRLGLGLEYKVLVEFVEGS